MNQQKSAILVITLTLLLFTLANPSLGGENTAQLDILYMNHGPIRPTINNIQQLLTEYPHSVKAAWYDFDQPAGKSFMQQQKLTGHIPLLLILNGKSDFIINGREVRLQGFPTGASPFKRVEGNWSLEDLRAILEQQLR